MSPMTALFIYFLLWWLTLFTVLPIGVKRNEEDGKGYDHGAPAFPNLKKKMILNTALSALILGIIEVLVETGILDWHGMFENAWK